MLKFFFWYFYCLIKSKVNSTQTVYKENIFKYFMTF